MTKKEMKDGLKEIPAQMKQAQKEGDIEKFSMLATTRDDLLDSLETFDKTIKRIKEYFNIDMSKSDLTYVTHTKHNPIQVYTLKNTVVKRTFYDAGQHSFTRYQVFSNDVLTHVHDVK